MKTVMDTATPALERLIESLTDKKFFLEAWGYKVARQAQRNAKAKSQGGNFWKGLADSVKVAATSNSSVRVECLESVGAHKHFGGTIRAKNAKALTIPISDEARNFGASDFKSGGRQLFVAPGTSVLGYSDGSKFCGLFALRKSVTQKAEPWWPSDNEILEMGIKEIEKHIEIQGG